MSFYDRRTTFDEVAELYDQVSRSYPEELVDDILTLSEISVDGRILEIGCGPGNATLPFAKRGYSIVGIELGERLAALAVKNCRAYPGVEIHNTAFEDWPLEEKAFDLAISAEAFHWIPPEIGYPRVAKALKDSGSAAIIKGVFIDPETDWSRAIDEVYRAMSPPVEKPGTSTLEWLSDLIKGHFKASGCFGEVTVKQYQWFETYTSEQYLKLLRTDSGYRFLDEDMRDKLFAGIGEVIERFGGQVREPQLVALFHSRVKR